jgi:hypothetical protein
MKDRFLFVYLAHGGWEFRKEAVLSISSLAEKGPLPGKILVYTDRPDEFKNLPVEPVLLTKSRIKSWQGPYGFMHRMKIELLRELLREGRGHLIFVDSDTVWRDGPARICEFLHDGCVVLQDREHKLSEAFFPEYLAVLSDTGLLKKEGLPVTAQRPLWMFNTGVVGLPSAMNPDVLEDALRMCDLLARSVPFKMTWVEQTAYSYIFQSLGMEIRTCAEEVLHYWRDSFEFSRLIKKCSQDELTELGKAPDRVLELIEEGRRRKRSFWNQLLARAKRLKRSINKRKRESLVFLETLKFRFQGNGQPGVKK